MMTSAAQELVSSKEASPGLQDTAPVSVSASDSNSFSRSLPGINIDNCEILKSKNNVPSIASQPIQPGSFNSNTASKGIKTSFTPMPSFDLLSAGVSSSISTPSNPNIQRIPPGLSSSFGGWVSSNDIWKSDYPPSGELPSSPNFPREPGSYNNSHFHSLHDPFLSRAGSIPSDSLSGYTRTRTTTGSEFRFGLRNPLACLNQESGIMDRRLSSSMSPMFGIPVDRSPMFRGYMGSPHSNSSYIPGSESEASFKFNPGDYYRAGFARRMSLTPNFGPFAPLDDLNSQMETLTMEEYAHILNRRHSVAASAFPIRKPPQVDSEPIRLNTLEENYDDQTEQFTLELDIPESAPCYQEAPKSKDTYYVVEFKIKRTDAFYLAPECNSPIKLGDKVIVQGDRGKDLGVVIKEGVTVEEYKKEFGHFAAGPDGSQSNKEVEPKKIYRLALPHEIALLPAKAEDEAKALDLVREKTSQREFVMKVVDAEYQWDRRKLTFYFISDRRIDFRDLVRELFKIYKTRIWMCAVTR